MRRFLVIALVAVFAGAGLWYARGNRRGTNTAEPTIAGNSIVETNGASAGRIVTGNLHIDGAGAVANRTAMLQGTFAVEGNLHTRSLPNGELVLEGDLKVRSTTP